LIAAARRGAEDAGVEPHLQRLPGGLEVLVDTDGSGPVGRVGATGRAAVQTVRTFATAADVLVDLGRLDPHTESTSPWLAHADRVCIVVGSEPAPILHLRRRVDDLRERIEGEISLVVVGDGPYRPSEISRFTGLELIAVIPRDSASAGVITTGDGSRRRLERSALAAAAQRLASSLARSSIGSPAEDDPRHGAPGQLRDPAEARVPVGVRSTEAPTPAPTNSSSIKFEDPPGTVTGVPER
jgi:hypothetical protein